MELGNILTSEASEVISTFMATIGFHLLLATIAGAIASVATQQIKQMFKSENRWYNLGLAVTLSSLFGYIVAGVYLKLDKQTVILVVIYTIFNAKLIYEAVGKAVSSFGKTQAEPVEETEE